MLSFDTPLQPILPGFIVRRSSKLGGFWGDKIVIDKADVGAGRKKDTSFTLNL
jgi:hypothetical protein